jgi:hypothetical protein
MTDSKVTALSAQCVENHDEELSLPAFFGPPDLSATDDLDEIWGQRTREGWLAFERDVTIGDEREIDFPENATFEQLRKSKYAFPNIAVYCLSREDALEHLVSLKGMPRTIHIGSMMRFQIASKWVFTLDELKYLRASCRDDNSRNSVAVRGPKDDKLPRAIRTVQAGERRAQKRFTPLLVHVANSHLTNRNKRNGKESEFIRFPFHREWAPIETTPPGRLSLGTYQRILNTRAARLMESVTPTNRKVVLCNVAAASLMKMKSVVISDAALYDHFRRASVYLHDLDNPSTKPAPPRFLSDAFPRPDVFIRGVRVTPENVDTFAVVFKRHKPYFRALVDYVNGGGNPSLLPIIRKVVAEHSRSERAKFLTINGMATTLERLDYMIAKKKWTDAALNERIRAYLLAPDGPAPVGEGLLYGEVMLKYGQPSLCPLQLQGDAPDDTVSSILAFLRSSLSPRLGSML